MHDIRFETRFTYEFIKRMLPVDCERILEVGCGRGELATRLSQDGLKVTAIDRDKELVAEARLLGADAHVAEWPDFNHGRFDAVLFTRSLHHVQPLRESVQCAAECLSDRGRIIVEDFAYESADEQALRWFTSVSRIVNASGLLVERNELLEIVLRGASLAAWRSNHEHGLNTATDIGAALDRVVGNVLMENAAYYFRYLARGMGQLEKRDAVVQALTDQETLLISDGAINALGRRFVATVGQSRTLDRPK
jgi:SAM-dependent methyltransferase